MARTYQTALVDELDPRRRGTMAEDADRVGPRIDNTGIAGGQAQTIDQPILSGPLVDAAPPATSSSTATPDYKKLGKYAGQMSAWSTSADNPSEKFARPWDQQSERYKLLTVLSNFDPTQGITPDVINALNAADIKGARFSGSGDKLNAMNLQGWKDFDKEGIGDVIQGFKTGKGQWVPWSPENTGGGGGAAPVHAGLISPLLTGSAGGNIQSALSRFGESPDLIQQLIARLQGTA